MIWYLAQVSADDNGLIIAYISSRGYDFFFKHSWVLNDFSCASKRPVLADFWFFFLWIFKLMKLLVVLLFFVVVFFFLDNCRFMIPSLLDPQYDVGVFVPARGFYKL